MIRGNGFLRLTLKEPKKAMDRAICQVHTYSRIGSQYEVDRMVAWREARSGKYDKQAQARNAPQYTVKWTAQTQWWRHFKAIHN